MGFIMSNYLEKTSEKHKIRNIILILTHSCNLNCTYCYEHNKCYECIDVDMAKEILEKEMSSNDDYDREIEFFGGEPFLEFDKIVELYEFLESREWPHRWIAMATTNGTLVHGEIKDWLLAHKENFKVALSADGTPAMHNLNRSNSYDKIDFEFFAKTTSVTKMTVSLETLPSLSEGIIHLHNLGFETVRANLGFGIDWSDDKNLSVYASELRKLADYYIENPHLRPSDIMELPIENINPKTRKYASRHCGAGVELVAYEIDGTAYPCHTFAPVSVSDEIASKALQLKFDSKICLDCFDKKCQNCIVASVCPNCYGINFSTTGNMYSKDDGFCRMIKVQFLANAYFKHQQYLKGLLKLNPEEEYRLLNNIMLVQSLEI